MSHFRAFGGSQFAGFSFLVSFPGAIPKLSSFFVSFASSGRLKAIGFLSCYKSARGRVEPLPRAYPWETTTPVGTPKPTPKGRPKASRRKARPRICLRKGCGRRYEPKRWNQRYCQDLECRRLLRRWQACRRQAARRKTVAVRAQHAAAQHARRQRAKSTPQLTGSRAVAPARGHAAKSFFRACLRPAGMPRASAAVGSESGPLLRPDLPSGGRAGCRPRT